MRRRYLALATLALAPLAPAQRGDGGPATVWKLLSQRHDRNHDGVVEASEYSRGKVRFARLDRNGDGRLTADDFRPGVRRGRPARRLPVKALMGRFFRRYVDDDQDDRVTAAEWRVFVSDSDTDADGVVTADELLCNGVTRRTFAAVLAALDADRDGRLGTRELAASFERLDEDGDGVVSAEEMQGRAPARPDERALPRAGDPAPDFELPLVKDPEKTRRLSSYRGKKPVALIFGSYT